MSNLQIDPATCQPADLIPAVDWLRSAGIVACATDTFYGLAVDPGSPSAVRHLFDLKGREARAALPLMAASTQQVEEWFGRLGQIGAHLAKQFWPGPLALVLDATARIAVEVHGGRRSIAIRVPAHRVAQCLCAAWGGPLTATSANRSGTPPAASVAELGVIGSDPRVLVIDAGATNGGASSTIVDARGARAVLVRDGAIPWSRVLESLKE